MILLKYFYKSQVINSDKETLEFFSGKKSDFSENSVPKFRLIFLFLQTKI